METYTMTTVIYHNADFDGIFCREIAKKFLGEQDVEYIGWNYGDKAPEVSLDNKLYILDLSIDELMSHPNLIWIDHHKTAIDKYSKNGSWTLNGNRQQYCIDGVAACRLSWQWFSGFQNTFGNDIPIKKDYIERRVTEPYSVQMAGEYDIWDKRNNLVDTFQFGLRSVKYLDWKELLSTDTYDCNNYCSLLLENGKLLQSYQQSNDASIIKKGFDLKFEGLNFLALNTPRCNSLSFIAGIKPEHDALLGFYFDGTKWNVSLYGGLFGKDIDLSKIAIKYGGGGHKQACGFNCKQLPFI